MDVDEQQTRLALLSACPNIVKDVADQASTYSAIRDCVVLHSRELSGQSTQGPIGLPNFFSNRGGQLVKNDSTQPENNIIKDLSGINLPKTRATRAKDLIIQIGKVYVRSSIQRRVDTGATWEDEILKLRISKEHWSQPEALMTILVQHDQQQASFPKVTLILCAMLV